MFFLQWLHLDLVGLQMLQILIPLPLYAQDEEHEQEQEN